MTTLLALLLSCAPAVDPGTMTALVMVESGANPWVISVNGGQLARQPRNLPEAIATAENLLRIGMNFDAGIGQINSANFKRYGLTPDNVFDPCTNLNVASRLLKTCYDAGPGRVVQARVQAALSCYNTGNFTRGFQNGYVQRVMAAAGRWTVPH